MRGASNCSRRVAWLLARRRLDAVARALVGEQAGRDLADDLVLPERAQEAGVGDLADDGVVQLPAVAERLHGREHLRPHDRDHPLLALGDHHLPGLHPLLTQRYLVEPEVDPHSRAISERGGEAGGAAVLERLDEPDSTSSTETSISFLPMNGSPTCTVGRLSASSSPSSAREHGRAADPVAAGGGAVEDDEVAGAGRARPRDPVGGEEPDAHRVHEHVVPVGLVEDGLAADRGDADGVPVCADARDGAVEAGIPGAKRSRPGARSAWPSR